MPPPVIGSVLLVLIVGGLGVALFWLAFEVPLRRSVRAPVSGLRRLLPAPAPVYPVINPATLRYDGLPFDDAEPITETWLANTGWRRFGTSASYPWLRMWREDGHECDLHLLRSLVKEGTWRLGGETPEASIGFILCRTRGDLRRACAFLRVPGSEVVELTLAAA